MAPRPQDYENIQLGGSLEPGGHRCVIKRVLETRSQTGKDMIEIWLDTDPFDEQPFFFTNKAAKANDGKWPANGIVRIVVQSEYYGQNIKRFITSVEESNDGFHETPAMWNDLNAVLAGKRVGCVYGVERYTDSYTCELRSSVKPRWFCAWQKADSQPAPEVRDTTSKTPAPQPQYTQAPPSWGQPPQPQYQQQSFSRPQMAVPRQQAPTWGQPQPNGYVPQPQQMPQQAPYASAAAEGFMVVPDALADEGLPFN